MKYSLMRWVYRGRTSSSKRPHYLAASLLFWLRFQVTFLLLRGPLSSLLDVSASRECLAILVRGKSCCRLALRAGRHSDEQSSRYLSSLSATMRVQARCGAVIGNIDVECSPETTVGGFLDRIVRSRGASTSTPDVVSFRPLPKNMVSTDDTARTIHQKLPL